MILLILAFALAKTSLTFNSPASVNTTVAYEMALEQIIADLDDLEERVENLNVDQKTNEDILLNVLKRVDETEKDLRKVGVRRFHAFITVVSAVSAPW